MKNRTFDKNLLKKGPFMRFERDLTSTKPKPFDTGLTNSQHAAIFYQKKRLQKR